MGQQIHARVVAVLESQFSEVVADQPHIVAWHCVGVIRRNAGGTIDAGA
jgi:hypothetical protein